MLDIFTTEGISFSARSANEAGVVLPWAEKVQKLIKISDSF